MEECVRGAIRLGSTWPTLKLGSFLVGHRELTPGDAEGLAEA